MGVATFDAQPRVSLPLGASAEDIVTAVQTLAREPSPLALSQDAMAAIRSLAVSPAARKAILFFGDESANPDAYYHEKLIAAARDAQVLVFGVVYPSTDPMAPALEALGQLAKESGGDLVIARAPDYELPQGFATDPFAAIDSGGRLSINLTPAIGARLTGPQTLTLSVAAGGQALEVEVPVTIGPPTPPPPPKAKAGAATVAQSAMPPWIWLSALAAAFLALSIILFLRTRRRSVADSPKPPAPPRRVPMSRARTGTPAASSWRRPRGGSDAVRTTSWCCVTTPCRDTTPRSCATTARFAIKDLDSLNGVFVDNKKVQWTALSDGTQIDIGDLRLTFSTDGGSAPPDPEPEAGAPTEIRTGA